MFSGIPKQKPVLPIAEDRNTGLSDLMALLMEDVYLSPFPAEVIIYLIIFILKSWAFSGY